MSTWFYKFVLVMGSQPLFLSSRTAILHVDRTRREGPFILAPNHFSPYDCPLLIRHTPRMLDWVSVIEAYRHPWAARFLNGMNALPLDRSKPDGPTVRTIYDRLSEGRVVAMFPEGHIRKPENSIINGGAFKPGVARIAQRAGVPIVPCVVLGARQYHRLKGWAPLKRTPYGIIYGEAIQPDKTADADGAVEQMVQKLAVVYPALYGELSEEMKRRGIEIVI